jgi:hypothetical protein
VDPKLLGEDTISHLYELVQYVYRLMHFRQPQPLSYYLRRNQLIDYIRIKRWKLRDYIRTLREHNKPVDADLKFFMVSKRYSAHKLTENLKFDEN